MHLIQFNAVLKARGPSFTLGPLDLTLAPGEILGIMGPNGAGKTSLLRLLWGFLCPDEGSISVLGLTPHLDQIQMRRQAGFVGDATRFYEWMSANEFLEFVSGFYPTFDNRQARLLLDRLELEGSTRIERLSRGGRVKLALISALAHHPDLVILDEPTSGLDPLVRTDVLGILQDMASEGVGVVLSSHLSNDLDRVADSVLMLDHGRIVEYGSAHDLLDKYNHVQLEDVFLNAIEEFPGLALHVARKDWRESRRLLLLLTTGLLVPAVMIRVGGTGTEDFAIGLLAGLITGTSFGYAQYCFLNERQRGTLETVLSLPIRPHELVLAKYVSVYSMVLVTVNVPALVVHQPSVLYVTNVAGLFLATIFMAATVMSAKPWAFQLPVWGMLLFVLPTKQILERYYPKGLVPLEALFSRPVWLATLALLLTPLIATASAVMFSRAMSRD